jgi:peptidoglycan DL-endopeptidase CwlO
LRFHDHGLRAVTLATLIALAGVSASIAPVAATDPAAPTDSPSPSATAEPTPVVDPAADPTPAPTEAPSPATTDPAPTADPAASVEPAPTADPSASPDPGATLDPSAPSPAPTVAPAAAVVAAVVRPNYRARIVRIARAQRGKLYRRGSVGPRAFDCSGLVRYAYRHAGVGRRLGGGHSARGMYYWARIHHLTSRSHPKVGDVVVWGRGSHVGIYIGRGRVVSALNRRQGIRITRLHALTAPFTTFIHTRI